jgi:hypothetical protein
MLDDKLNESPLLMIAGLWKKKKSKKSGREFLTGGLTYGTQVFVFENKFKNKPTDPDFKLYIGAKIDFKKTDVQEDEGPTPPINDDELPF